MRCSCTCRLKLGTCKGREADLNEERSLNRQLTHSSKIHALEVVKRDRMIMDMRAEIRDLTRRMAAQKTFIESKSCSW